MIDSKRSVVVGRQGSLDALADDFVVPDHGGQGQHPLPDPGEDAGGGPSTVQFEVELALVGVEHGLDGLPQRLEELLTRPRLLALAGGSQQRHSCCGQGRFEFTPVVVLVRDQRRAVPGIWKVRSASSSMPSRTWRSSALAPVTAAAIGSPCRVHNMCSRSPQKYRLCEAQYPYSAKPARSDRLAVSRDRPHSTGVESAIHTSSSNMLVRVPSARMSQLSVPTSLRSLLLYPGCWGRCGN